MKTKWIWLTLIVFICNLTAVMAQEKEVTWLHADFPPITIPKGADKGTGHLDKMENWLVKNLKGYTHSFKTTNYKRIMYELKEQKNVACVALFKNKEREAYIAFSDPIQLLLPNGVITTKKGMKKLKSYIDGEGRLDLDQALKKGSLKIGVASGRTYSGVMDEVLNKYSDGDSVLKRSGTDVFEGLLNMMLGSRVDLIAGYATESQYFARKMGISDKIRFIPVKGMPQYLVSYVGAPKNAWGKKLVAGVNQKLKNQRATDAFLKFYTFWLDEGNKARYRKLAKEFFK